MVVALLWDAGEVGSATVLRAELPWGGAALQLFSKVLAEAFAHQVESERVDAGVGEGQNAGTHTGDKVAQRGVHLVVVVGAVQVDHMTGQPADGKEADEHQHDFGQALPGLDLLEKERRRKSVIVTVAPCCFAWKWLILQGKYNLVKSKSHTVFLELSLRIYFFTPDVNNCQKHEPRFHESLSMDAATQHICTPTQLHCVSMETSSGATDPFLT